LTRYDFSTAILRVDRKLHEIGTTIFHANDFILMSTNDHELLHHAANNLLPFWQLKLAKFRGYHLRLNILHRLTPRGEYMFVLILADDLDLLVTSIRRKLLVIDDRCEQYRWQYNWNFEVRLRGDGMRLPLPTQRALLEPFKKIRYREQRCVVRGEVDPTISGDLRLAMTPSVFWTRADEVGAFYNLLCVAHLSIADLFSKREYLVASLLFQENNRFLHACSTFAEDILHGDDAKLKGLFKRVCGRLGFQRMLIGLHLAFFNMGQDDTEVLLRDSLRDAEEHSARTPTCSPMIEIICAICHFLLGRGDLCWARIDRIYEQTDEEYNDFRARLQEHERSLPETRRSLPDPSIVVSLLSHWLSLTCITWTNEVPVTYSPSAMAVAEERYILKALSYAGDMLDDHAPHIPAQPAAFDTRAADKTIARHQLDTAKILHKVKDCCHSFM